MEFIHNVKKIYNIEDLVTKAIVRGLSYYIAYMHAKLSNSISLEVKELKIKDGLIQLC